MKRLTLTIAFLALAGGLSAQTVECDLDPVMCYLWNLDPDGGGGGGTSGFNSNQCPAGACCTCAAGPCTPVTTAYGYSVGPVPASGYYGPSTSELWWSYYGGTTECFAYSWYCRMGGSTCYGATCDSGMCPQGFPDVADGACHGAMAKHPPFDVMSRSIHDTLARVLYPAVMTAVQRQADIARATSTEAEYRMYLAVANVAIKGAPELEFGEYIQPQGKQGAKPLPLATQWAVSRTAGR